MPHVYIQHLQTDHMRIYRMYDSNVRFDVHVLFCWRAMSPLARTEARDIVSLVHEVQNLKLAAAAICTIKSGHP